MEKLLIIAFLFVLMYIHYKQLRGKKADQFFSGGIIAFELCVTTFVLIVNIFPSIYFVPFYTQSLYRDMDRYASEDVEFLRNYTLNVTRGCDNDDCRVQKVFDFVWRYKTDPEYAQKNATGFRDVRSILDTGVRDCKDATLLMYAMLKSVEQPSWVMLTDMHMFLMVRFDGKYIFVDPANGLWEMAVISKYVWGIV